MRKAVDYIRFLQNQNKQLIDQNRRLKESMESQGGNQSQKAPQSGSQNSQNPQNSGTHVSTRRSAHLKSKAVPLLAFMLGFFFLNPFNILPNSGPEVAEGQKLGRSLLSLPDFHPSTWGFRILCFWGLNVIVAACVLARYFGHRHESNSESNSTVAYRHLTQAQVEIEKVKFLSFFIFKFNLFSF